VTPGAAVSGETPTRRATLIRRWLALFLWTLLGWIILTWTRSAEQLAFGAAASALIALACTPLGDVIAPWRLFNPRRAVLVARLAALVVVNMVKANLSLSRRIWSPSRPLRPGMVIVPTKMQSDGALTAVGLLSSLIVDNQIVDLDRRANELQYHAVWVTTGDGRENRSRMNGPIEDLISQLEKR
jgi:multicomponent Na+:H+ antiporter subunit E